MADAASSGLKHTPLYELHTELGARLVPFAGYAMPVQYNAGILAEHAHTRRAAGLFDVSHMGQARLRGDQVSVALETVMPGDIQGLAAGAMRYSLLLNDAGGIIDDLMITRPRDAADDRELGLVVNAARKETDFAVLAERLHGVEIELLGDRALLALQGPQAATVLTAMVPAVAELRFLEAGAFTLDGADCQISRSGYTGEDGFELSIPATDAAQIARRLLAAPGVAPIGLGARDSLRLEAGLCLYGHDIDEQTTPVEAGLSWAIAKRRRIAGGFPGAERILQQLGDGPARRRVGLRLEGRAPAREGTVIHSADGAAIGRVTSGGFGPTIGGALAMGYVEAGFWTAGTPVQFAVRGRMLPGQVVKMPFVQPNYYRGD